MLLLIFKVYYAASMRLLLFAGPPTCNIVPASLTADKGWASSSWRGIGVVHEELRNIVKYEIIKLFTQL